MRQSRTAVQITCEEQTQVAESAHNQPTEVFGPQVGTKRFLQLQLLRNWSHQTCHGGPSTANTGAIIGQWDVVSLQHDVCLTAMRHSRHPQASTELPDQQKDR